MQIHGDLGTRLLPAISMTHGPLVPKGIHTISEHRTSESTAVENVGPKTGFVRRMLKKAGILDVEKYVIKSFSLSLSLERLSKSV